MIVQNDLGSDDRYDRLELAQWADDGGLAADEPEVESDVMYNAEQDAQWILVHGEAPYHFQGDN